MDYLRVPREQEKRRGGIFSKIIAFLLLCILALSVYGLFFYNGAYDEANALVSENTQLKKEIAEKDLKISELEERISSEDAQRAQNQTQAEDLPEDQAENQTQDLTGDEADNEPDE